MVTIFFWAVLLVCCALVPVWIGLRDYTQNN